MNVNHEHISPYYLHLASWYPNKFGPHDSTFVRDQVHVLSQLQNSVLIAVIESEKIEKAETEAHTHNNLTEYITYIPKSRGINRYIQYFKALNLLSEKVINEMGLPKLVHVHVGFKAVRLAYNLYNKYAIPYIVTEHFTVFSKHSTQRFKRLIRLYCKYYSNKASQVIGVGSKLSQSMLDSGIKKVSVIPNYIDESVFKFENKLRRSKSFLHISSLAPHKNPGKIIDAFNIIAKQDDQATLTLLSSNDARLRSLENYKMENYPALSVSFKKGTNKTGIAREMQKHDTLVMFSDFETFSMVAAEAACCGMKIIATRSGGPEEFLDPSLHILLNTGDQKGLFVAMEKCLHENNTVLRENFSKTLGKKLGVDSFKNAYLKVYESVVTYK